MSEEETKEYFTKEWNRFGVVYKYDQSAREIKLYGNHKGIETFANLLDDNDSFTTDSLGQKVTFLGPYAYLKLLLTDVPTITSDTIAGCSQDFTRLASLIRQKAKETNAKGSFTVGPEYSKESKVKLRFILMDDDFSPAQME